MVLFGACYSAPLLIYNLLIWIISFFVLVNLAKRLPMFYLSIELVLNVIDSLNCFCLWLLFLLHFFWSFFFSFALVLYLPVLGFGLLLTFFKLLRYIFKVFICTPFDYLMQVLSTIKFPRRTVFSVSHRFWHLVFLFSLISRNLKCFPFLFLHSSFFSVLFNHHEFV